MVTAGRSGKDRSGAGSASPPSEFAAALHSCRGALVGVGVVSSVGNILMLTAPFFMLEIYDRVLPGRKRSDARRIGGPGRHPLCLSRYARMDPGARSWCVSGWRSTRPSVFRVFDALVRMPLKARTTGDGIQPLRDLDQVRAFLSSTGPLALFDFPWVPLYLGICFLFHPWIGMLATIGATSLVVVTFSDRDTHAQAGSGGDAAGGDAQRFRRSVPAQRRGAAGDGHGRAGGSDLGPRQPAIHDSSAQSRRRGRRIRRASSKVLRIALQSAVLALGAYLVIHQEATAGIIIASSILTSRAPRAGRGGDRQLEGVFSRPARAGGG